MQNVIRRFAFQQFLQGIFDKAFGQNFRRVVRGGFLPFPAGQTVNESAFGVHAQFALFVAGFIADTFFLRILRQFGFRNKIADIQFIEGISGAFDFVQILLRNKAAVGEQSFVYRTHLVDAQIGIRNTSPTAVAFAGGTRQAH